MFDQIPTILTPEELLDKALGRAAKIQKEDAESFYRARKTTSARMESLTQILAETLGGYVKKFPNLDRISTYERELVDLMVGVRALQRALSRLDGSTETIERLGRTALGDLRRAPSKQAILDVKRRLVGRVSSIVRELDVPLRFLADARAAFHRVPDLTPGDATIVIAGYPNVGKSSLLAKLSRARPEIAPYPYTTKHANVGHFHWPEGPRLRATRYQLVDTPGLLDKKPSERVAIERHAALALTYLADAILFVLDPSEACGYPLDAQERLLRDLRGEFHSTPVLVVENKADLAPRASENLQVSCATGKGLSELKQAIVAAVPPDQYEGQLLDEEPSR